MTFYQHKLTVVVVTTECSPDAVVRAIEDGAGELLGMPGGVVEVHAHVDPVNRMNGPAVQVPDPPVWEHYSRPTTPEDFGLSRSSGSWDALDLWKDLARRILTKSLVDGVVPTPVSSPEDVALTQEEWSRALDAAILAYRLEEEALRKKVRT